jgi:hypothetical protein
MGLAVGQNQVVQAVNDCIAVYDKASGALLPGYPKSLNTFLGTPANNFDPLTGKCIRCVTDPRVMYDFVADRFVIVALFEDLPNSRGFLELAASQTNNPTAGWNVYRIQVGATGQCPDYPTLGQNFANDPFVGGIYVGFNNFSCSPRPFSLEGLWKIKSSFYQKGQFTPARGSVSISGSTLPSAERRWIRYIP